jgi:tetratricopeptide (TPR) repeat protein
MAHHHFIIALVVLMLNSQSILAQNNTSSTDDTTSANGYFIRAEKLFKEAKYDSAGFYYKKAGMVYEKLRNWQKYVSCLNKAGSSYIKNHALEQTLECLELALLQGIPRLGNQHPEIAESYHNIGLVHYYKGDYDQAIKFYNKSLSIKIANFGENYSDVAKTYNNIGVIYMDKGKYSQAIEILNRALTIWLSTFGENHPHVTATYNNIGYSYMRNGNYDQALEFYNKALSIQIETLGGRHPDLGWSYAHIGEIHTISGNYDMAFNFYNKALFLRLDTLGDLHPYVAWSYGSIGQIYKRKGNYQKALEFFNKALSIRLIVLEENHPDIAWTYNSIGSIYEHQNDFDLALEFYTEALAIELIKYGDYHPDVAQTNNNIGNVYNAKGEYDRALEYCNKALFIWHEKFGNNHPDVAVAYNNIGNIYESKSDYIHAIECYNKALSIWISTHGEKHPRVALSYSNLGDIYEKMGEFDRAFAYYQKALAIQLDVLGNKHPLVANTYKNLGVIYFQQEDIIKALDYFQKSVIALIPSFSDNDYYHNPPLTNSFSDRYLLSALVYKAGAFRELFNQDPTTPQNLRMALSSYQLVSELIKEMRYSYKSEGSKLLLGEKAADIYDNAIYTTLIFSQLKDKSSDLKEQSFIFAEESKSAVLFQSLQESHSRQFTGISDSLLEKEKDLRIDLTFYKTEIQKEKLIRGEQNSLKLQNYENLMFSLSRTYEKLIEQLEHTYPEYYDLKYKTETAAVSDIQKFIDNRTALLEYFLGDSSIYIFAITKDHFDVKSIKRDFTFNTSLNSLVNSFKTMSGKSDYLENAVLLYKFLITPVESQISNKQKWIIIPDGELYKIPFEALLSKPVSSPEEAEYTDLDYLVKEHEISYHYSATLYLKSWGEVQTYEKDFVGFAPVFSKGNATVASDGNSLFSFESLKAMWDMVTRDGRNLDELKYSETEVIQIRSMFATGKSRVFVHQDASEDNFKKNLRSTKYVHVATHGFMRSDNPKLSNLIFSQPDSSEKNKEDGILYSGETYNLDLDADLLILSACQTGTGKLASGEGIMALTRGFLYSGTNNIIASLWRVFDEHTSLMMVELYKQILEGKSYSAALRDAKLQMINNKTTARPQSWASFILIGI